MKTLTWLASTLILTLTTTIPAEAAENIYLTLTGQKSGAITGGVTQQGHEGSIRVLSYDHEIGTPLDAATDLPIGKRQNKPLTLTVLLDQSFPLLYQALTTNENLTKAMIVADSGQAESWSVALANAQIIDIHQTTRHNQSGNPAQHVLQISLIYHSITWTKGGNTAMGTWGQ